MLLKNMASNIDHITFKKKGTQENLFKLWLGTPTSGTKVRDHRKIKFMLFLHREQTNHYNLI